MRYNNILNEFYWEDIFGDPEFAAFAAAAMVIVLAFMVFFAACSLVLYILRSIGLYKLAANRGMSNPGLAWIPIFGIFRAGAVADDISAREGSKTYLRHIILGGSILSWIMSSASSSIYISSLAHTFGRRYRGSFAPFSLLSHPLGSIASLVGITAFVFTIMALHKIYKCYHPLSSTSWTVLSVIFPFLQPIFLFALRNRMPEPEWESRPQGYYPGPNWPPQGYGAYPPPHNQNSGYYPPQPSGPQNNPPERDAYQPPQAPEPPELWNTGNHEKDEKF